MTRIKNSSGKQPQRKKYKRATRSSNLEPRVMSQLQNQQEKRQEKAQQTEQISDQHQQQQEQEQPQQEQQQAQRKRIHISTSTDIERIRPEKVGAAKRVNKDDQILEFYSSSSSSEDEDSEESDYENGRF